MPVLPKRVLNHLSEILQGSVPVARVIFSVFSVHLTVFRAPELVLVDPEEWLEKRSAQS